MDKKVLTFKSGQFVFSQNFSTEKIYPLLAEAKLLYITICDIPILPHWFAQIEEELIRKSIFGTAAIEGNPLTEERVGQIIAEPDKREAKERAEREIQNLKRAYGVLYPISAEEQIKSNRLSSLSSYLQAISTEEQIKNLHAIITAGIETEYNLPGRYRNHIVKVGDIEHGGVDTPPKCLTDIENLMKEFIGWINSEDIMKLDVIIRAGLAHYHLALIHPFGDGNGRTARLVEAAILRTGGMERYLPLMLSNFYYKNIDDYFWAFSNSIKSKEHDVTPFLEFVLRGAVDSLKELKETIMFFIRKVILREGYAFLRKQKGITQREHDFLITLLDYPKLFSLSDMFSFPPFRILYSKVSERTARRDLERLSVKEFLLREGDKYTLNLRALG